LETFTGANGTFPNTQYWLRSSSPSLENTEFSIQNNMTNVFYSSTSGVDSCYLGLKYNISNDFLTQVYLNTVAFNVGVGGALYRWFRMEIDTTHYMYYELARGYSGYVRHQIMYNTGAGLVTVTPSPTMEDNIYLRFTRTGSLWNALTSTNGTSWTSRLSNIAVGSGTVATTYMGIYRDKTSCNINWDNFYIQYGTVVPK